MMSSGVFCTIALTAWFLSKRILLDSQFLLAEQVAAEGKRAFAPSYASIVPIPGSGGLAHCDSFLPFGILQWTLYRLPLEEHSNLELVRSIAS